MKIAPLLPRLLITLTVVALAAFVGWHLWDYYMREPWTRDGRIRADIIQVAPDVSGLVTDVEVADNQLVQAGDLLFTIDADRYRLSFDQAEAMVESKRAEMEQRQRDLHRLQQLNSTVVTQAQREQAESNLTMAGAGYRQALADLQLAELNLKRTEVRAVVNGYVTNLQLRPGNYVQAGHAVVALIDSDSFYVDGYFEETKLPRIQVGDRVSIALMGISQLLQGHVESIASGIVDRERSESPNLLPNINPTFNWVRLAQRIPVRIAIDHVPEGVRLAAGLTATVAVQPGDAAYQRR